MTRSLTTVLMAGAIILTAGAARSWAGAITFSNSSIHPDGALTAGEGSFLSEGTDPVDDLMPLLGLDTSGTCGPTSVGVAGCNDTPGDSVGATSVGTAEDFGSPTSFSPVSGPDTSTPDTGSTDPVLDAIVSDPGILSTGAITPEVESTVGWTPDGPAGDPTDPVSFAAPFAPTFDVVGPGTVESSADVTAVPESGSLFLVGMGLIVGANYLRRRRLA